MCHHLTYGSAPLSRQGGFFAPSQSGNRERPGRLTPAHYCRGIVAKLAVSY